MATRITEYDGNEVQNSLPIVPHALVEQAAMTATGTSAQSAAFGASTDLICVNTDEQIYTAVASNPTATTNSYRIAAGGEQWFAVKPGEKVAIRT